MDLKGHKAPQHEVELQSIKEELESWVIYGPRAKVLLDQLQRLQVSSLLRAQWSQLVERYVHHPQADVAQRARGLVEAWKTAMPECRAPGSVASDDDSDVPRRRKRKTKKVLDAVEDDVEVVVLKEARGWTQFQSTGTFRGRKEVFWNFKLDRPFGNDTWALRVRIAKRPKMPKTSEILELLQQMAMDLGALGPSDDTLGEEKLRALQRLQRLEQRFSGPGVTEAEARNALRLFERELSKANWTEEKFAKLKRQLAGTEEWSAADLVVECLLGWVQKGQRRQAWFANVCERLATPLGIECGYAENGGSCFMGPLSAAVGATLTSALVCHLGQLDLKKQMQKTKRISTPQFMQGFVDGALDKERHLVWEKLFSIEDGEEAAQFCQDNLREGFFDGPEEMNAEELRSMLESMFTGQSQGSGRGREANISSFNAGAVAPEVDQGQQPKAFAPFSGKAHRLDEEEPKDEKKSWAITFASNLELARSSRRRSREEAHRSYHWTFSARTVKETKTGTTSYTQGRSAGEKRKQQIERATGTAKTKFRKGAPLAITT